jgi:hypothetical protein
MVVEAEGSIKLIKSKAPETLTTRTAIEIEIRFIYVEIIRFPQDIVLSIPVE